MRLTKILISVSTVALICVGSARADAGGDLAKLLRDFRQAEGAIALPQATGPDADQFDTAANAAYFDKRRQVNSEYQKRLGAVDRTRLSGEDQISYDVFRWDLDDDADELRPGVADKFQLLPLNQFDGSYLSFARQMQWRTDYPFTRAREYDDQIKRMLDFTHRLGRATAEMREGLKQGVVQPKVLVARMLNQIDAIVAGDADASVFMGPLKKMPASISGADRTRLEAAYREAVEAQLIPAYKRLGDFLRTEYLPKARDTIGLSAVPGGRDMYLYLVKSETTADLTPDQIHALGLSELKRIENEEERAMKAAGFAGTLVQFRAQLRSAPRFQYKSPDAMLADFRRVRDTALAHLDAAFDVRPKATLEFRFYEPYAAPDKPAAEYSGPSGDGKRPGIVYLNDYDLPARTSFTSEALALHEGIPGHHLQVALAQENHALPNFRRYGGETAFTEGWALYAESLGPLLGLYTDPYQKFGELDFDAWRASRLVVDTGIHWLGWSHEQAVTYLTDHTTLSPAEAAVEVDRYIAIPAQALAYKIGEREFLALRAKAESALGPRFDLRKFHDAVLSEGALPLSVLDAHVNAWITAESAAG